MSSSSSSVPVAHAVSHNLTASSAAGADHNEVFVQDVEFAGCIYSQHSKNKRLAEWNTERGRKLREQQGYHGQIHDIDNRRECLLCERRATNRCRICKEHLCIVKCAANGEICFDVFHLKMSL